MVSYWGHRLLVVLSYWEFNFCNCLKNASLYWAPFLMFSLLAHHGLVECSSSLATLGGECVTNLTLIRIYLLLLPPWLIKGQKDWNISINSLFLLVSLSIIRGNLCMYVTRLPWFIHGPFYFYVLGLGKNVTSIGYRTTKRSLSQIS